MSWWDSLTGIEQFYYYFAVPASLLLVIQTVMTFFGIGEEMDGDVDTDIDVDAGDGDMDVSDGIDLNIFTLRNMVAFFTFFGWSGIIAASKNVSLLFTVIISLIVGLVFMGISMGFFILIAKMQISGNMKYENTIGKLGKVYIPIPPKRDGYGKVNIAIGGALTELEAVTDDYDKIETGSEVKVLEVLENKKLLVTNHF